MPVSMILTAVDRESTCRWVHRKDGMMNDDCTVCLPQTMDPAHSRDALASRIAQIENDVAGPFYGDDLGVSITKSFLRHLGVSITNALGSVPIFAESSRVKLRDLRSSLHAAVDERFDELEASLDAAEAAKILRFERDLIEVDSAFGNMQSTIDVVNEALATLSESDLDVQHTVLSGRLDELDTQLRSLLATHVELPQVGISFVDLSGQLARIAGLGRVISPKAITATDLTLEGVPHAVRPGNTLSMRLSLSARLSDQSTDELDVSLSILVGETAVVACLEWPGAESQPMQAELLPDPAGRCIRISFLVPDVGHPAASLRVLGISVAGKAVAEGMVTVPLRRGMWAPLSLKISNGFSASTLCISPEGRLFAPCGPTLQIWDGEGVSQQGVPVGALGLSENSRHAAYAYGDTPSLLLADDDRRSCYSGERKGSRVVSVDPFTYSVRWASPPGELPSCDGIATLSLQGIVVIISGEELLVRRLTDGVRVGSLAVPGLRGPVAADNVTGLIFATVIDSQKSAVHAWSWSESSGIVAEGFVDAIGDVVLMYLAVVPPTHGKPASYLVAGGWTERLLRVVSLPDFSLVRTHWLENLEVHALAADPSGDALIVYDEYRRVIRALVWPLPDDLPSNGRIRLICD